jgi:hypothetical protein
MAVGNPDTDFGQPSVPPGTPRPLHRGNVMRPLRSARNWRRAGLITSASERVAAAEGHACRRVAEDDDGFRSFTVIVSDDTGRL